MVGQAVSGREAVEQAHDSPSARASEPASGLRYTRRDLADQAVIATTSRSRISELFAYRQLIVSLTRRDLSLKYKGSVLGVAWSLLNPLLQMAIYTLIFSFFLRIVVVPHYWIFVIAGILFWTFFSTSLIGASSSFVRNPQLISKVYFPIEALPISMVLANLVNYLIPLALLLIALPFSGVNIGPSLMLTPVVLAATFCMTTGLSLVAATVTVFLRDIEHFIMIGIQIFFYATPILYPLSESSLPHGVHHFVQILRLNPLAWYMDSFHAILYFGIWPTWSEFTAMIIFSIVSLGFGYWVFARFRATIPENI